MSDTRVLKLELIEWLAAISDHKLIEELAEWKEEHQRVSLEKYNSDLDEADRQIDNGDFFTQDEVEARAEKW